MQISLAFPGNCAILDTEISGKSYIDKEHFYEAENTETDSLLFHHHY